MEAAVILENIDHIPGWFDLKNIQTFQRITLPKHATIFEIGTYCGRSATALSLMFPGSKITTCDPCDQPVQVPEGVQFINTRGSDSGFNEPIDLLFIDDSHKYKDIEENYRLFSPLVKQGGYIAFHDYHDWSGSGADDVKKFIDDLGGADIVDSGASGEFGLAIIEKK